ncbi:class I SAM-dependent methyltransferase [Flexivirga meconopsidis]|uniref:class I SAM-dependent methyltransferase n=1 Tax=Flexivirga meconopsidis TaxID=2977121 RepID=UPI00223F8A7B|nr:class I SAM-dependent methyltransferase [Flexivirga meconopsidis]
MDASTLELRDAHDVLAGVYREKLGTIIDEMPIEQAVLGLFCGWVRDAPGDNVIGDIGCGTGRLAPYLAAYGMTPRGVDLSPEMVRVAREDYPDHDFRQADARELPFADGELAGAIGWYSLMYLDPQQRRRAFAELARVIRPGGYFAMAYKQGNDQHRRASRARAFGVDFDIYWLSAQEVECRVTEAGFGTLFWAGRPAGTDELQPQGYLVAQRRCDSTKPE